MCVRVRVRVRVCVCVREGERKCCLVYRKISLVNVILDHYFLQLNKFQLLIIIIIIIISNPSTSLRYIDKFITKVYMM